MNPLLSVRGLVKRYGGVLALDGVDLDVEAGSIHALIGENGAGKSTLGRIVAGLVQPDTGTIELDGKAVKFAGPSDALRAGIGIVHQELLFCENLTVAENLSLAEPPRRGWWFDRREANRRATEWLSAVGAEVDPETRVSDLSVARQQLVQIAGAIAHGARLIIFDEPTSSLSQSEAVALGDRVRALAAQGVACVYVTHRLDEAFAICDRATVLRDGRLVGTYAMETLDRDRLIELMIGRSVEFVRRRESAVGEGVLSVERLTTTGCQDVSLSVRAGEVVGLAGLVGAGRTELLEAIFGLRSFSAEHATLHGKPFSSRSPQNAIRNGIGLIPEDRKRHGLMQNLSGGANASMGVLGRLSRFGWIRRALERNLVATWFDRLRIRARSPEALITELSGGNQQKVVLARWLAADCDLLLVDEPTRGVDVAGKAEIHALLQGLADQGKAVLFASSDLPELLTLADRILVLRGGRLVGEVRGPDATEANVMALMAGVA